MQSLRAAWADLREALGLWRAWVLFAFGNVTRPYRRTFIGPLWEPIGLLLLVLMLAPIYSRAFDMPYETYLIYLATGWTCWQLISGFVTSGSSTLVQAIGMMQQSRLPLSLFFLETVTTEFFEFLIKMALVVLIIAVAGAPVTLQTLLLLPALALLLVAGLGMIVLFGLLCARFPDFRPVVHIGMRLAFFVTPVLWHEGALGLNDPVMPGGDSVRSAYVDFNPLYHLLEVVRAPMMGQAPASETWIYLIALTLLVWSAAAPLFVRWRGRVVYWS